MIQNTYTMATPVVYGMHTRGFHFDKPLGLRPRALWSHSCIPHKPLTAIV